MKRRDFCKKTVLASSLMGLNPLSAFKENTFFKVQKQGDRWWLIEPKGKPFYTLGLNHIDAATMMFEENVDIWRQKYDNSMEKWLRQVGKDIQKWGFNSTGWVQEVVIRNKHIHRQSRLFTYEEYQWLGLPYCHMLPFANFHHWDTEYRHPLFFTDAFEEWCDYVARAHCTRYAQDPNLIGYFYIDCPAWIHHKEKNAWKGAIVDPERAKTAEGKAELRKIAQRYYQVTHDAIRRYDPHHLIFGDRYEANNPMSETVIKTASEYIDVLSFQHFDTADEIAQNIRHFYKLTGKPILLADFGVPDYSTWEKGYFAQKTDIYRSVLATLRDEVPECIGMHFCGAYMRNNIRRHGLYDRQEELDKAFEAIYTENQLTQDWLKSYR